MAVELTRLNALRLGLDLRYLRYCTLEIDIKNLESGLQTVLWIRMDWLSQIRILIGNADPDPGAWKLTKINK
jgi:hypothetical protein